MYIPRPHRTRRRRGAVILFFLLVALPLVWVAGALSVDYSKVITTRQQAELLLDAASLAAAMEINSGDCDPNPAQPCVTALPFINPPAATAAAKEICDRAFDSGAARLLGPNICDAGLQVQVRSDGLAVTVSLRYAVRDLMFFGIIDQNEGWSKLPAESASTASVCIASGDTGIGLNPVNGGACSRTR
jgi:hypothetical protein